MGQFSFDIQDSKGLFDKLTREYRKFIDEPTSSDDAINFSLTAYHLFEWIKQDTNEHEYKELIDLRNQIGDEFQIIRDIANGSKHRNIDRYQPKLKVTKKHDGAFSSDFSSDFDISVLQVELSDGREFFLDDIVVKVYDFWKNYFDKIG